ncbi:MAG TPA: SpoIIE family protein phosphatase [Bryobacteraceae bacterium]|nr:SpoIIE family protein phosphatase [Bryobacteraceae bacterium]
MAAVETVILRSQLQDRRGRLESARKAHPEAGDLSYLLEEVDAALERMDRGVYGLCEACHEPVESERLLADPLMRFCLAHLTAQQQEALEQDLEMAARIQSTLLPGRVVRNGGWEAAYRYQPLGPVSGDYCDLMPSAGGGLLFITGDVSGKGVASSLLMSHLHAIFRSLLSVGMPISDLLERANRVFCESTLPSFYATLVCGHAHADGDVEICNAGHCPPVVVRRGSVATIETASLPLGLFCTGRYAASRVRLEPGDALVLYTDGLTEARNQSDEEYTAERLAGVLRGTHGLAPQRMTDACLADLETFLAGAPKSDDLTLMVIERLA